MKQSFFKYTSKSSSASGFSLVELAGVLTIIAMVTAAILVLADSKINEARIESTRKKMEIIEKALQVYVKKFGYLPCPANIQLAAPSTCAGDATCLNNNRHYGWGVGTAATATGGSCSGSGAIQIGTSGVYYGMVPFKTIDPSLDGSITVDSWGNRIVYIIDERYTNITTVAPHVDPRPDGTGGFGYSNAYSANTNIVIRTRASGGNIVEGSGSGYCASNNCTSGGCGSGYCENLGNNYIPASAKVAYALLSHGSNSFYARSDRNPGTAGDASSNADEIENNFANTTFVQRLIDKDFDDILRYKTRWHLE
jgi:type II secretory pathway pseudopilin PulG